MSIKVTKILVAIDLELQSQRNPADKNRPTSGWMLVVAGMVGRASMAFADNRIADGCAALISAGAVIVGCLEMYHEL